MNVPLLKPDARTADSAIPWDESRSALGAALRTRREAILRTQAQLLNWDEIERELVNRGGEAPED